MILFKQSHWPIPASYLTITKFGGTRGLLQPRPSITAGITDIGFTQSSYIQAPSATLPESEIDRSCSLAGSSVRRPVNSAFAWGDLARYVWRQFQIGPFVRSSILFLLLMTWGFLRLPLFISFVRKYIRQCPIGHIPTPSCQNSRVHLILESANTLVFRGKKWCIEVSSKISSFRNGFSVERLRIKCFLFTTQYLSFPAKVFGLGLL